MHRSNHHVSRIGALSEPELLLVRQKLHVLRTLADEARRRITIVNSVITEVAGSGLLSQTGILGPVVQSKAYPPTAGGSDSGLIIQSALLIPGGIGSLAWDSELFFELRETVDGLESESWRHFMPFDECEPAVQALLCCQIDNLIRSFVELVFKNAQPLDQN